MRADATTLMAFPYNLDSSTMVSGGDVAVVANNSIEGIWYTIDGASWLPGRMPVDYVRSDFSSHNVVGITYGGGKFVAICTYGTILLSYNGIDWITVYKKAYDPSGYNVYAGIAYNEETGTFVAPPSAFSGTGTSKVLRSTDGTNWTENTVTNTWTNPKIKCLGGIFFWYYSASATYSSTNDGLTWSSVSANRFLDIAYNPDVPSADKFVALGTSNTTFASTNGASWVGPFTISGATSSFQLIWTGSRYVAGVSSTGYNVAVSSIGESWSLVALPGTYAVQNLFQLDTGEVVVGAGAGRIYKSDDNTAASWRAIDTTLVGSISNALYHKGNILVASTTAYGFSQDGGETWTDIDPDNRVDQIIDMAFNGTTYIAITNSTNYLVSTDKTTWTRKTNMGNTAASSIVWTGINFVVGCASGIIRYSPDATDNTQWAAAGVASTYNFGNLISNGNGTVVACDANNGYFRSTDHGVTWAAIATPPASAMLAGIWDGSQFVLSINSNTGALSVSPDGNTWSTVAVPKQYAANGLGYGNSTYIVIAREYNSATASVVALVSSDLVNWEAAALDIFSNATMDVVWTGTEFILYCSPYSFVLTSKDGRHWNEIPMPGGKKWGVKALGSDVFLYGFYRELYNIKVINEKYLLYEGAEVLTATDTGLRKIDVTNVNNPTQIDYETYGIDDLGVLAKPTSSANSILTESTVMGTGKMHRNKIDIKRQGSIKTLGVL